LFTVVIPTHNRPEKLLRSVGSALEALKGRGNVIVVDDGSVPPVSDLCSFGPKVRLIRNEVSMGASAARNLGVALSSGDVVVFLDDDDVLNEGYIRRIQEIRNLEPRAKFGFSNYRILEANGLVKGNIHRSGLASKRDKIEKRISGLGMGFWIERELFLDIGGLDVGMRIDEDTDLCVRLASFSHLPWRDTMAGTAIDRGCSERLTNATGNYFAAKAYFKTLQNNVESFDNWSAERFFLCFRAVKKCAKGNLREMGIHGVRLGGNLFFKIVLLMTYFRYRI